jgi:hypothetical protein
MTIGCPKCRDSVVDGVWRVCRGRKKWLECVVNGMGDLGPRREDAMDCAE